MIEGGRIPGNSSVNPQMQIIPARCGAISKKSARPPGIFLPANHTNHSNHHSCHWRDSRAAPPSGFSCFFVPFVDPLGLQLRRAVANSGCNPAARADLIACSFTPDLDGRARGRANEYAKIFHPANRHLRAGRGPIKERPGRPADFIGTRGVPQESPQAKEVGAKNQHPVGSRRRGGGAGLYDDAQGRRGWRFSANCTFISRATSWWKNGRWSAESERISLLPKEAFRAIDITKVPGGGRAGRCGIQRAHRGRTKPDAGQNVRLFGGGFGSAHRAASPSPDWISRRGEALVSARGDELEPRLENPLRDFGTGLASVPRCFRAPQEASG